MHDVVRLIVRPAGKGRFTALLNDEPLLTSRTPYFDGARALLARGYDPAALMTMRHAGAKHDSFVPLPIGKLAKLTIEESDARGLRIRKWQPLDRAAIVGRVEQDARSEPPATLAA